MSGIMMTLVNNVPQTVVVPTAVLDLDAADYSGSGNWLDTSGYNNNAVAVQTPTYSASQSGYWTLDGGSYPVSGTGLVDSFNIADASSLDSMSSISIIIWFYISSIPNADPNLLFSKRTATSNGYVGFYNQTLYRFRVGTSGTGSGLSLDYSVSPTTATWQQIAVTVGAAGGKVYKNGSLVVNDPAYVGNFSNIDTSAALLLGDVNPASTGVNGFAGRISMFSIYNGVLSAADIQTNFDTYKSRYGL